MVAIIIGLICMLISLATEVQAIEAICFMVYCVCAIWSCGMEE